MCVCESEIAREKEERKRERGGESESKRERERARERARERERERERDINTTMREWLHLFQIEEPRSGLRVHFLNIGLDLMATTTRVQGSSFHEGIV